VAMACSLCESGPVTKKATDGAVAFCMKRRIYLAFTASFRALPGRNFGTRAFLILISSPVRGLRPVRAARSDTAKVPKPTRVTEPFFFRVVFTAPTKASRARPTSALERSVLEEICSISSVLFIDEIPLRFIVFWRTIRQLFDG